MRSIGEMELRQNLTNAYSTKDTCPSAPRFELVLAAG